MAFSTLRVMASVIVASGALALAWGCAQSPTGDLAPSIDPNLPDVDASWDPAPTEPSEKLPPTSSSSSSSSGDTSSSSGGKSSSSSGGSSSGGSSSGGSSSGGSSSGGSSSGNTSSSSGGTSSGGPASKPTQGEVLISEVMYDPSGNEPASEWIEIYNPGSSAKKLSGLTLLDGGNRSHTIGGNIVIDPGAYVVLARSKSSAVSAKVPSAAVVYEYGVSGSDGIQMANGATGGIQLKDGGTIIAQAQYGGWYTASGSSIQLKTLTYPGSIQKGNWCVSTTTWAGGSDNGTPGAANDCN